MLFGIIFRRGIVTWVWKVIQHRIEFALHHSLIGLRNSRYPPFPPIRLIGPLAVFRGQGSLLYSNTHFHWFLVIFPLF